MVTIRNLIRNKLRNGLTAFGVAIGISIYVSLTSVTDNFQTQIKEVIKSYNIDIAVQSKGAVTPLSSKITKADFDRLGEIEGIADSTALVIGPVKTSWNPYLLIIGVSSIEKLTSRVGMLKGRVFTAGRQEMIIGQLLSREWDYDAGNKMLVAEDEMFDVTGIFSGASRLFDSAAVVDIRDAQRILKRDEYVNLALLRVRDGREAEVLVRHINERFSGLTASRTGDVLAQIKIFGTIDAFTRIISIIAFAACGVIVMNTLFMAITERTREIGILMAIGWSRLMIARMIVLEAAVICLLAGIVGNCISFLVLFSLNVSHDVGLGWVPLTVSPETFFRSIILAVAQVW